MNIPFVDLKVQYHSIKEKVDAVIADVLENTAFVGGDRITLFEEAFADYIGVKHCIGCGNGTDSMEIILQAMGIGTGDEVIVPANSWISTSEVVTSVGATPVFVDILPDVYTIDPSDIRRKLTTATKAIMPVHLYGMPARMDEIMQIAGEHQLIVIEDCAQAHGAKFNDQMTGAIGHASSFSFYPGKNLGAYGDAGAMLTNDDQLAEKIRIIANHGQKGKHNHLIEGRNSRMDVIQAEVLSVKLPYLEEWTEKRIFNARIYNELLKNSGVVLPIIPDKHRHVFHVYEIRVKNRSEVMDYLREQGIGVNIHYPTALPFLKAYERFGHQPEDFPVAAAYQDEILSLPMYPELSREQIEYVCEHLLKCLKIHI